MRTITKFTLCIVALLLLVGTSLAQQNQKPPVPPRIVANPLRYWPPLYQNVGIQQQLNLSPQQIYQLNQVYESSRNKYKSEFDNLSNVPVQNRLARWQDYQRMVHGDFVQSMNKVLTPAQVNGYRQLYYQQIGPGAFSDSEIRAGLGLSGVQLKQFRGVGEVNARRLRTLYQSKLAPQDAAKRWQATMKRMNTDTGTILNENQRQQWAEMIGQSNTFQPPVIINPNKGK
jgi:hypothetical protein